jgi:outer membrane protein assembly factor BamB
VDGQLYALAEKNQELRLVCLDAREGRLGWSILLAIPPMKALADIGRRVQAAHLACANGLLVCTTNAGAVFGVDLLTRNVVWAYPYQEAKVPVMPDGGWRRSRYLPPPKLGCEWKLTSPVLHGNKVLFTAPDEGSVHCVNLRDGTLCWKTSRFADVYLAGVHGGKVLLISRQGCRALDASNGAELWQLDGGVPAGCGVFAGGFYHLLFKPANPEEGPVLCAIDLEWGGIVGQTALPATSEPGNLLLHEDGVLCQGVTTITAYPRPQATGRTRK